MEVAAVAEGKEISPYVEDLKFFSFVPARGGC